VIKYVNWRVLYFNREMFIQHLKVCHRYCMVWKQTFLLEVVKNLFTNKHLSFLHMHSKSNHSQTCSCGLQPIKRYAHTYFVIKIVNCILCSWSRKSRTLEDSMAIYRCQTASQISLFVGFLTSLISLHTKTTKIGTPQTKVISQND